MFLSIKHVFERYSVSRSTIWRWVSEDRFPKPLKIAPGTTRSHLDDLEAFESVRTNH